MSKRGDGGETVSVIVPTRSRPRLLERAIGSVLRQSHRRFEVLVVEDGAGDGAEAARKIGDGRIVVLDNHGRGEVAARNLAIEAARGQTIAFLDDDDLWVDETLLARMASRLGRSDCLVYSDGIIAIERPDGGCGLRLPFRALANRRSLQCDNRLLVSGIAYRRSLHDRLGNFDAEIARYWDWDWYLRLVHAAVPFARLAGQGVIVAAGRSSQSSKVHEDERLAHLGKLARKHGLPPLTLKNHLAIALDDWRARRGERAWQRDGKNMRTGEQRP